LVAELLGTPLVLYAPHDHLAVLSDALLAMGIYLNRPLLLEICEGGIGAEPEEEPFDDGEDSFLAVLDVVYPEVDIPAVGFSRDNISNIYFFHHITSKQPFIS
jgi:hypothetical protein